MLLVEIMLYNSKPVVDFLSLSLSVANDNHLLGYMLIFLMAKNQ